MIKENQGLSGHVPSEPGSREPSPDGLGPSGFDPSRVIRITKIIRPEITIERPCRDGEPPDGRREIWARHEERPEFDALLVTVHYSYAYLDNSTIGGVAVKIARLLAGSDSDGSPKGGDAEGGSVACDDSAGRQASPETQP